MSCVNVNKNYDLSQSSFHILPAEATSHHGNPIMIQPLGAAGQNVTVLPTQRVESGNQQRRPPSGRPLDARTQMQRDWIALEIAMKPIVAAAEAAYTAEQMGVARPDNSLFAVDLIEAGKCMYNSGANMILKGHGIQELIADRKRKASEPTPSTTAKVQHTKPSTYDTIASLLTTYEGISSHDDDVLISSHVPPKTVSIEGEAKGKGISADDDDDVVLISTHGPRKSGTVKVETTDEGLRADDDVVMISSHVPPKTGTVTADTTPAAQQVPAAKLITPYPPVLQGPFVTPSLADQPGPSASAAASSAFSARATEACAPSLKGIKEGKGKPGQGKHTLSCKYCGKLCRTTAEVFNHEATHLDTSVTCPQCLITFLTPAKLAQHDRQMHSKEATSRDPKRFYCETPGCGASYSTIYLLKSHLKVHAGETQKCPYCAKVTGTGEAMRKHIHDHHQQLHQYAQAAKKIQK